MEVIARLGKEKEEVDRRTGNKTILIKDWTGMDFASSARAAENRTRWKEIVTKAFVVPIRPCKVTRMG